MSFPDREQRKLCWDSRDRYWECLDDQNIKDNSEKPKVCLELRRVFEKSCPTQWVTHFDRKRDFNVFKEKMQKEGFEPIKDPQRLQMEELAKLIAIVNVETCHLSFDKIQNVMIIVKRIKEPSNNKKEWNGLLDILWSHIQTGLDKMDEQLLCATCFFSVIVLTDKQEFYMMKMQEIIQKEILVRSEDLKDSRCTLQAASLIYGMFQSSFLTQCDEKSHLVELIIATFDLLTLIGYEYSQFTFIAFKTMSSFQRVCGTELQGVIFNKENQMKLLNLVNHNWENPITGIRDLNKEIFQTLVGIIDEVTVQDVIQEINGFYWNKAKYLMLSEVLENYKGNVSNLVSKCNWIEGLIHSLHKPGLVSAGADMYYAVLKKLYSEDVWCNLFLDSITKLLIGPSSKAIENFCNYWLLISLKKLPLLMNILIDDLETHDDIDHKFYSILFIMKKGTKLGILNMHWDSADNFTKAEKIVLKTIEHKHSKIRILTFDILCLTQNKTLPCEIEYSLVLEYIKNNMNSDCTILRLNMLNSLNIFLSQLHILYRNMKDNNKVEGLLNFCKKLQELAITCLNLNGNYQRKSTTVKVINTIIYCLSNIPKKRTDQIKASSTSLKEYLKFNGRWKLHEKSTVLKLISLLKDPSDDIRDNVGRLLINHYFEEISKTDVMNQLVEDALQSMKSKFFFEISCGQSMFKLVANLLLKEKHTKATFESLDEVFNYGFTQLVAEYKLKHDVLKSIEDGKQLHSFINILIVGLEVCTRHSYKLDVSDADMNELLDVLQGITNQFTWEQENSTSSDFSKINEMVENIILKSGYDHMDEDETKISGLHQIVLNCLWLNVKASCDLACLLINYHKNDIEKCGKCLNIITHVLETSRHKGVIEGAGSALGCGIQLLTSLPKDSMASELPQTLLKHKLDILILEASKMASITRRGAGLSIMVHKIVASDMRKGKPLFHYFMKTLLETCQNAKDIPISLDKAIIENQMDLPKAIFIHFLTKIVTDSSLASDMMFYSAHLAELGFSNLTSPHWQIRNAALQLYGALIPRLIGQMKASGTGEETIATVGCDELRTHSPKLWKFILEQLKNEGLRNNINSHSNLVPILNLLASSAKRYNFSCDSKEQDSSDKEMLLSLIRILDSPIHTVRRLTAKCIFNIFSFESICDVLLKVGFVSENMVHGALILLSFCVKYNNLQDTNCNPSKALKEKFRAVINTKEKHSYWSQEVYTSIYPDCIDGVEKVLKVLDENITSPGIFSWAQTCIRICIMNSPWIEIPHTLDLLMQYNDFELYCEILLHKMEKESCPSKVILRQIEHILLSFERKYESSVIWRLLFEISHKIHLNNVNITAMLKELNGRESSYTLRYFVPLAARLFVNIEEEYQVKLADMIFKMCNFESTDVDMRHIAALANNELANSFENLSNYVKVVSFKTAIILLQDEDEDVRNVSVDYYKNIRNLEVSVHPNICLNKMLDCNFLQSIFPEPQQVTALCNDLILLLTTNVYKHIDEYNPFANNCKNIYLEVEVLQETLKAITNNFQ